MVCRHRLRGSWCEPSRTLWVGGVRPWGTLVRSRYESSFRKTSHDLKAHWPGLVHPDVRRRLPPCTFQGGRLPVGAYQLGLPRRGSIHFRLSVSCIQSISSLKASEVAASHRPLKNLGRSHLQVEPDSQLSANLLQHYASKSGYPVLYPA